MIEIKNNPQHGDGNSNLSMSWNVFGDGCDKKIIPNMGTETQSSKYLALHSLVLPDKKIIPNTGTEA